MFKVKVTGIEFGWRIPRDQINTFVAICLDNGWEGITIEPAPEPTPDTEKGGR